MSRQNDDRDDLEDDRQTGEAEDTLRHAPSSGSAMRDFFSFEEIFTRVLSTADHELQASNRYLFWSGLGAGGAIGLSILARIVFTDAAGESEPGVVGNLLYPVGFVIVVLGRYQLFTENTLTPVVLVLTKFASVANLIRLWIVVLIANLAGAFAFAAFMAYTSVLDPEQKTLAEEIARSAFETEWGTIFAKAIIAGWLVAAATWLVHGGRDTVSKILFVYLLLYLTGVGGFFHIASSSVEVFDLALSTDVAFLDVLRGFVLPVLLGNTLGGVTFVAVLNYAKFAEKTESDPFESYGEKLPWREWMMGVRRER